MLDLGQVVRAVVGGAGAGRRARGTSWASAWWMMGAWCRWTRSLDCWDVAIARGMRPGSRVPLHRRGGGAWPVLHRTWVRGGEERLEEIWARFCCELVTPWWVKL